MKMDQVVRTVRFGYVLLCILLCAMGGLLIFFPGTSLKVLCRLLGGVMLVCGAAKLIGYLSRDYYRTMFAYDLALGVLLLVLGLALFCFPGGMISVLYVIVGILALTDSVFKIQTAVQTKRYGVRRWWLIAFWAGVTGVLGLLLVLRPFDSAMVLIVLLGVTLVASGIENLFAAIYAGVLLDR